MRGNDEQQGAVFSYVSAERRIRAMTDAALRELSGEFDALYAAVDGPRLRRNGCCERCCCKCCIRGGASGC